LFTDKKPIEDPQRIKNFFDAIKNLDWSDPVSSLNTLFEKSFELIKFEIEYYYIARKSKKRLSALLRSGALLFGSLGILAPLAELADLYNSASYGYLFLAAAGAFLTANNLFGGTSGHIRFVTTQLELEKKVNLGAIQWNKLKKKHHDTKDKSKIEDEMFKFILATMENCYSLVLNETSEWNKALKSAVEDYEKNMKKNKKGQG
jgi:hypothetical protein